MSTGTGISGIFKKIVMGHPETRLRHHYKSLISIIL